MPVDRVVDDADADPATGVEARPRQLLLLTVGFAVAHAVTLVLARVTLVPDTLLVVLAPGAGIAAAWFAFVRPLPWRVVAAGLLFTINVAVLGESHASASVALGFGAASVVQVVLFTWLMERRGGSRSPIELAERLDVEDLGRVALFAMLAALVTGALGPASLTDLGDRNLALWAAWAVRNTVTVVAFYPLALLLLSHVRTARDPGSEVARRGRWTAARWAELAMLILATLVACWLTFGEKELPVTFLILATSAWVGARFTPLVANLHAVAAGGVVARLTIGDRGLLSTIPDPVAEAAVIQAFIAVTLGISMSLALHRRTNERLTERLAEAEREARGQAEMLEAILAASEESVVVLDGSGRVLMRNRAAVRLGGGPADQGLPTDDVDLRRPGGPRLRPDELPQARALAGEAVVAEDYVLRTRYRPEPVIVQLSAVVVPSIDGEPLAVLLSQDVTAVRRERDELTSFAAVVAHDLLNPLTAVDGWSDALEDELDGPEPDVVQLRSHLRRIRRGSERMHALIRDLLAYTTARSSELTLLRVDLTELVAEVVAERIDAARAGGVEPEITVEPLPVVHAQPLLVRQAIDNIVGNALKYVAPGVTPRLDIRARRVPAGERGAHPELVELQIADNGIGIPADQRIAVFDTFHRVHRDGYKGTGLGLSIVKRVAERHGGTVEADENPAGAGTLIRLALPAAPS
ncbi:sensor histidine kinase [Nocardioides ferulae]|uniref:sensor histidine kinase n=1 Tax=Nocardioides ferulae TaxID=2340821 RepID=UPI000EB4BF07|nr:sensor histidine kinase [Nocardioides ferulae]